MTGMPQVRSLLYLVRKHALLLAAVAAVPLAAGWLYARRQEPGFRAAATVQIKARAASYVNSTDVWIDADPQFVPDQVYRIRSDEALAGRVLARVKEWTSRDPLPEPLRGGASREALRAEAESLRPADAAALVTVSPVPETSYHQVAVPGRSPTLIAALANAYALEIVALFREEKDRDVGSQIDDWERQYQERRDAARERVEGLGQELARLQSGNPGVDFLRRANGPQQQLDAVGLALAEARERRLSLQDERQSAAGSLAAAGLALESVEAGEGRTYRLCPAPAKEPAEEPRLLASVQALPAVERDAGVRDARERIANLQEADASLAVTYQETAAERIALRQRTRKAQADLARATEAALAGLAVSLDAAAARVARFEARAAALDAEAALQAAALAKADALQRRIEDHRREIDSLDGRLAEAARVRKTTIQAGAGNRHEVRLVREASVLSVSQVSPDLPRIWMLAVLAALGLAAGVLYLFQVMDDTVKSREDYDRLVRGLAFLGVVPAIEEEAENQDQIAAVRGRTGTPVVESIRALRTTLHHAGVDGREIRTILMTSSGPREGKTTLSTNLAASLAQGGHRTLLMDADLRRPRVHRMTGTDPARGLSTVLAGRATLSEAVQSCGLVPGLDVLPSGPLPPNPAELLAGPAMKALLEEAAGRYDRIVLDSPPVVTVTDPCVLAPLVDAVVLVIAHGTTSARLVRRAREAMDAVGARVSGAVVNNAAPRKGFYGDPYYGYDYRYGYVAAGDGPPPAARRN